MRVPQSNSTFVLALMLSALALVSCVVNPATGKKQLILISEAEELQIGRENDEAIVAQLGLYDDEELQVYINRLGQQLASRSERPDLEWTFRVLDDPVVNAFALPGGYIYVTRGILAHMNSEAELASVLGHEIGHVTGRHTAKRLSKAQLVQLGLGVGTVLAPEKAQQFGGLAQTGLSLLFLKYSREDERQADELGLRYLLRSDYDPRPMAELFDTLGRVSEAGGRERVPGWLSTHPLPENRRQWVEDQLASTAVTLDTLRVERDPFLRRLDNLVFGENPRQGFFQDALFVHPDMEFVLRFPQGWTLRNQRRAVAGLSEARDAMILLTLSQQQTPQAALQKFVGTKGMARVAGWAPSIQGFPLAASSFTLTTEEGILQGLVAFIQYQDLLFQLVGYTEQSRWSNYAELLAGSLTSFDRLTDPELLAVQPRRLKLATPSRSMSVEDFRRRYDATVDAQTLALVNHLDSRSRLEAGRPYKVVIGGRQP